MRASMEFTGLDEYLEKLQQAGKDLEGAADQGLAAAGEILITEMRARVPVGSAARGDKHPGQLRNHLTLNGPFSDGHQHYIYAQLDMRDRESMLYGVYQEFGTKHMKARSYIRAARSAARGRARSAMIAALKRVLDFEE